MTQIERLYELFLKSTGVCTDTRKIQEGNMFFALKGPNFNGNKFAEQALNDGASIAIVDEKDFYKDNGKYILVDDVLKTLQLVATVHRESLDIPVLGITGSNGKTTSKEIIHHVLAKKYKVFATEGNLNNHIGVPLSLLSINDEYEIAIIEMGANHIGEIASYCKMAQPTHGLITNIGRAHIGEFGGFENIIIGKSELFDYLKKHDGVPFINTQDKVLKNMQKRFSNALSFPNEGDDLEVKVEKGGTFLKYSVNEFKNIETNLVGQFNYLNVAAALCIGQYFEVPLEDGVKATQEYLPENMRSQMIKTDYYTIILDAYNANPDSMELAIKSLGAIENTETVVILGDMLELGDTTELEHEKLGELTVDLGISKRYYCGTHIQSASKMDNFGKYFKSKDDLIEYLKEKPLKKGSTILIKGSRKNALEDIVPFLTKFELK
ncbi:UDP-N-acetylmuramoyl-tripeptide--D-alanyl-D-alanine ligase [Marivirga arenosa]|uniref:UDP-N-acetylmuramoyl-tripeptide--D-alanyl-D-alanine ligase n=1 Tax=Marivirga arenosa TaxID=3059076 RepID=A0AA52EZD7_9BACT|nr:UDP-N-acetylmuramoyl-tripeptide--D-alanyl-D-alanine ligase [Marivirga sp. BKB1-2]WNB18322.1 UDP-N-acetylmuramoyl-tripeptide--D-alanyl-D-alanine ligase [Marivirga sp. BKB1-2]